MHRTRALALAGLGALAPVPLLVPAAAGAATEATQACPAAPRPHNVQRLAATFQDGGNADPADDVIVVTLTLCGKASARSAYEISFDVRPPLFSAADRNGDGAVDRRDFCAQTRDAFSVLYGGPPAARGGSIGEATLAPGAGSAPDAIRFTVPVDAIAPDLPRDAATVVYLWAETRRVGATSQAPFTVIRNRAVVDRLPVPDVRDGCALPQAAGETLAVALTEEAPPSGPNLQICICADEAEIRQCAAVDCDSGIAQDAICGPLCAPHGGQRATGCLFADPSCGS